MSFKKTLSLIALSALLTGPAEALAAGSEPPPSVPAQNQADLPQKGARTPEEKAALARREAEALYQAGWDEVEKAKSEARQAAELSVEAAAPGARPEAAREADKLRQSGQKRLRKSIDKFKQATELDATYHEAWNMLGYCYRKTGQLGNSSAAYRTCLKLKPDYAEAHEYVAQLALLMGNAKRAQEELAWLRKSERKDLADRLALSIERQAAGADSASLQSGDW